MRNFAIIGFCLISLTIAACGPTVSSYRGPTGELTTTVRCTTDPSKCYRKASSSCNGGTYRVMNSYRNSGGVLADIVPGPVTWYTMSVTCGRSDGVLPNFPLRGKEPSMPEYNPPVIINNNKPKREIELPTTTTCREVGRYIRCNTR